MNAKHTGGPARSCSQREADLRLIEDMIKDGLSVGQIASLLNSRYRASNQPIHLSQEAVRNDIAEVTARWQQAARIYTAERLAPEIAELDFLEGLALDAYARSLETKTSAEFENITAEIALAFDQVATVHSTSLKKRIEQADGALAFLDLAGVCIEQRCRLLGLFSQ